MVSFERHNEAMEKLNALVNVRERCAAEARMRLAKAGFSDEEIDDAVECAVRCGIVSDERYARAFIRGKCHLGWGRNKVVLRLRRDGVSDEVIDACSDEFDACGDEFERAMREVSRRPCTSRDLRAGLMRRLVSKGYSYDIAARAVEAHLADDAQDSCQNRVRFP